MRVCVCVCDVIERWAGSQTWGDLADGGGVPAVPLVAVGTLDEDGAVAEALGKNLPADVIQPHPPTWAQRSTAVTARPRPPRGPAPREAPPPPICLLVISTVAFLLTLLRSPRQKRSELEGSVKPSTVSEGCEAWKVSPTRWFSS